MKRPTRRIINDPVASCEGFVWETRSGCFSSLLEYRRGSFELDLFQADAQLPDCATGSAGQDLVKLRSRRLLGGL